MMSIDIKRLGRILLDSLSWVIAILLSTGLRFDGLLPEGMLTQAVHFSWLAASISILLGYSLSLYTGRHRNASLEEFLAISISVSLTSIVLFTIRIFFSFTTVPRSIPLASGAAALVFQLVGRVFLSPTTFKRFQKNSNGDETLIYGAGILGRQLIEQMLTLKNQYSPVGFLDDDSSKLNLRLFGRKIFGNLSQLERVAVQENIKILVVAISGIDSKVLRELESRCRLLGIALRIVPSTHQLLSGNIKLGDIANISEEDLLGRRPLQSDDDVISRFIKGKSILITGAGGSIGSEIARQIHRYSPSTVAMLDRDETALLNLQLSLDGTGLLTNKSLVLGDVRDRERMEEVVQEFKPDIVFHAAALKHLTMLERFPKEAYKTNVIGTLNVLEASEKFNVKVFVNISTDKAADPTCHLGKSKLITERLVASARTLESRYLSVRFGNVVGSNGSFIHTFRKQIENGGPVTVTDPEVTRYFMTVSEAVQLVLHSSVIGKNGETLILDMGEAVHINAIAEHMIQASGLDIAIKYTGLRDGEKLHEILISSDEKAEVREHPSIMHTQVEPIADRSDISWT